MVDANDILRIYPSVVVEYERGIKTTISFEWYEQNFSQVKLLGYALIFTLKNGKKVEEFFDDYHKMVERLQSLQLQLQNLKKD